MNGNRHYEEFHEVTMLETKLPNKKKKELFKKRVKYCVPYVFVV